MPDDRPAMNWLSSEDLGRWILGLAALGFGAAAWLQGDFTLYWQPVPDYIPYRAVLAFTWAGLCMASGAGLLHPKTARPATLVLVGLCLPFPVFHTMMRPWPWLGIAEWSAIALGAAAVRARLSPRLAAQRATWPIAARCALGLCCVVFGLSHFLFLASTVQMIPAWMPGDAAFWALSTGVVHVAVGIALLSGRGAVAATRVAGPMYLAFAAIIWLPGCLLHPEQWLRWAGNAITLAVLGGVWSVGDYLVAFARATRSAPASSSARGHAAPSSAEGAGQGKAAASG
ncbi:MAG: hypothetical protein J7500_02625 [Sphingomonas sp.]|uniref:hypothetical protein n=1 Tax=Sphingomonas sp. TaxID=28214 RepID=UPI001B277B68|nr:hypothetical protein [Sphingomonas sp.]MBO9621585.1 hypothetical protein [Sphingomonas sp.]